MDCPQPHRKPYPLKLVRELLTTVTTQGSPSDASRASIYRDELDVSLRFTLRHTSRTNLEDYRAEQAPGFIANAEVLPGLGISARYSLWFDAFTDAQARLRPLRSPTLSDNELFNMDADTFGSGSGTFQDIVSDASFGTSELWFQAGTGRNSVGPIFEDGVVVDPKPPRPLA